MEKLQRIATHDGIVVAATEGTVTVQIQSVSACASCQAHAHCGFAESKNKTLDIATPDWQHYPVGTPVSVSIDESRGLKAVWIAYLLPALLLLTVAIGGSCAKWPEGIVAVCCLATLAIYIGLLYLCRHRLEHRFSLTLSPSNSVPSPSNLSD